MSTLKDTTSMLARAPDAATWLSIADNYIQTYNRMPDKFVLPAEHVMLKPIIEAFASDAAAFADYIRALRDVADGTAYDELHKLYRTISIRALQVVRRNRLRKAVLLLLSDLEPDLGKLNYEKQLLISRFVEQTWGAMRMRLMDEERKELSSKRLSSEERSTVLDAFWADLDTQLENGLVRLDDGWRNKLVKLLERT